MCCDATLETGMPKTCPSTEHRLKLILLHVSVPKRCEGCDYLERDKEYSRGQGTIDHVPVLSLKIYSTSPRSETILVRATAGVLDSL